MPEGVSVDLGSALPYLEDRILSLFGKDAAALEWRRKIRMMTQTSLQRATSVQCVGMAKPVPISQIYQATHLIVRPQMTNSIDALKLLQEQKDAFIFAGPGWGKTTLLHWVYYQLTDKHTAWMTDLRPKTVTPIMFTLRLPSAVDDLREFVDRLGKDRKANKAATVLLLIDGYDEVDEDHRHKVSQALVEYQALKAGPFWLTCRTSYEVLDVKAHHYEIGPFTRPDALNFVSAFMQIYGVPLVAEDLLNELDDHGFSDFSSHPLMLALVCILKSGPSKEIPRRAIGLIRRAIDTLTFRWDEAKGIHRPSTLAVDGEERVRAMMRVAYDMTSLQAPQSAIERSLRKHVSLMQNSRVSIRALLQEMAQWYGLLVPVDSEHWQFVHRTIHDYLAARFWVESGDFMKHEINNWDMRVAYATCLVPDATSAISRMLRNSSELGPFDECLYNAALFENEPVARALLERISKRHEYTYAQTSSCIRVGLASRCLQYASSEFLARVSYLGSHSGTDTGDAISLTALYILRKRGEAIDPGWIGGRIRMQRQSLPRMRVEVFDSMRRGTQFLRSSAETVQLAQLVPE